jgi:hypothetical protein
MEVSGKFHVPATWHLVKELLVSAGYQAGWALESICVLWKKYLLPLPGIESWFLRHLAHSLVTIQTVLSKLWYHIYNKTNNTHIRHYYRKENAAIKNKIFLIMQNSITIHCEWRMWLFTAKQDLKIKVTLHKILQGTLNKTCSVQIMEQWGTFVRPLLPWKSNNYYVF